MSPATAPNAHLICSAQSRSVPTDCPIGPARSSNSGAGRTSPRARITASISVPSPSSHDPTAPGQPCAAAVASRPKCRSAPDARDSQADRDG
jgi:hypothetical protein